MPRGDWKRVSRRRPCPVCGKPDWCLYAGFDDCPSAAICTRVESPRRAGMAGWLHRLRDDDQRAARWFWRSIRVVGRKSADSTDFAKLAAEFIATSQPGDLMRLASRLDLSVASLRRLGVGWSASRRAWTFPMRDADGRIRGIRLRLCDGRKLSVKGGREGLFIPTDLDLSGRLLVCEGPTDAAAMLDLGLAAVGRPSCTGGVPLLVELVQQHQPVETVIVADGDGPGERGANHLAEVLVAYARSVRVISPPVGIRDARDWKQRGARTAEVIRIIEAAPFRRLAIKTRIRKVGNGTRHK